MNCPACNAEMSGAIKFCPYCGAQGATRYLNDRIGVHAQQAGAAPALIDSESEPTLRLGPLSKKLPRKYARMIERGANPEQVIMALIKANTSMRAVLESVIKGIKKNEGKVLVELLTMYLRSHCQVCGERVRVARQEGTALCLDCGE